MNFYTFREIFSLPPNITIMVPLIYLRPLLAVLLFLAFGCETMNWETVELNSDQCANAGTIMAKYTDQVGEIKYDSENSILYIYLPPSDGLKNGAKLLPCNVSPQNLIEYSSIKFTGLVYSQASESDSTNLLPSGYIQTLLSKAQVSKE